MSVRQDRIIQIGAVASRPSSTKPLYSEFQATVFTDHPIHPRASAVTGLYQKDLIDGISIQLALTQLWAWVQLQVKDDNDQLYCLAYNGIAFDFQLLFCELARHQLDFLVPKNTTFVDPYLWLKSRRSSLGVKSLRLADVHLHLAGAPILQAHTALADARALSVVCEKDWFEGMLTFNGSHVWTNPKIRLDTTTQTGRNTPIHTGIEKEIRVSGKKMPIQTAVDTKILASDATPTQVSKKTTTTQITVENTPIHIGGDTRIAYENSTLDAGEKNDEFYVADFPKPTSKRRKIKHDLNSQKTYEQ